ncbi:MAG: sigma-54-dependent Fis family transcriptional regulator, partial [Deltaproteobacteria bacterium]|nr:sigma-54-dependent Fis family transcriptional regulator [Deltaproteobacteria bacterium]
MGKQFNEITHEAMEILFAYDWPGNVGELANVIERTIVLGRGPKITVEDLPERLATGDDSGDHGILSFRDGVNIAKKKLIRKALAKTQGNRHAAAKALGLHEKYLLQLIKTLQ